MPIGAIEFEESQTDNGELEVTMRGQPEKIMQVLIHGLPLEALQQMATAMDAELRKRSGK
jgi:hypothetical protein